jgi:hypothetical protein
MTILFFILMGFASAAQTPPQTLLLDLRSNGQHRAIRPLAECQWREDDLVQDLKPDLLNVGFGTILKITDNPQIKMLNEKQKLYWQPVKALPAYKDNGILIHRFTELSEKHGKRGFYYETEENIEMIFQSGKGFPLKPGDLIVSSGDPALLRFLFAAPAVEFQLLKRETIDGVNVYRPTKERGVLPMESIVKSAITVFPTNIITMTGERQHNAALKKAKACSNELGAKP